MIWRVMRSGMERWQRGGLEVGIGAQSQSTTIDWGPIAAGSTREGSRARQALAGKLPNSGDGRQLLQSPGTSGSER
jgi:hypothetical protein